MLTKKGDEIALRPKEFLDKYDIEVELKKEVRKQRIFSVHFDGINHKASHKTFFVFKASKLDAGKKEVTFKDGSTMKYDKLFIGTGGT